MEFQLRWVNVVRGRAPVCGDSLPVGQTPSRCFLRPLLPWGLCWETLPASAAGCSCPWQPPVCSVPSSMPLGRLRLPWHGIVVEQRTKGPGFS